MKRSQLKRGGPLKRKTKLRARSPRKPRAPRMPRAALKRGKPMRKAGARKKRERVALDAFREAVMERALGHCELCDVSATLEAHHLVGRGRAAGWIRLHDPEINGLGVCTDCHRDLTLDPKLAGAPYYRAAAIWKQDRNRGG